MDSALTEIEEALKERWPRHFDGDHDAYEESSQVIINREWHDFVLPTLNARAAKQSWPARDYHLALVRARQSIWSLFEAVHQVGHSDENYKRPKFVWIHRRTDISELTVMAGDDKRGFSIDKADLLQAAAEYLAHPETSTNMLDWQFLDAIVFQELDAFAYQVFYQRAGLGVNWAAHFANKNLAKYYLLQFLFGIAGFIVSYLLFPALAIFLLANGHAISGVVVGGVWAVSMVLKAIAYPARRRTLKKVAELLKNLAEVYGILGNSTISPGKLKAALDTADASGVALDGAVFTIVDRMIARDATAFIATQNG